MTRADPSGEPARELAYRRLHDRITTQDGCITWLLVELRALQKRVDKLEQRNETIASAALRLAQGRSLDGEAMRGLEQHPDLPAPPP